MLCLSLQTYDRMNLCKKRFTDVALNTKTVPAPLHWSGKSVPEKKISKNTISQTPPDVVVVAFNLQHTVTAA